MVVICLAGACGTVGGGASGAPDAAAEADAPAADGAAGDAVVDRNCAEVKARLGTASDGVYRIDPDRDGSSYRPFEVFCAEMATVTPKEYLELARTTQPADAPSSNYATYATGAVHAAWTCDCGVVTTLFSKIRIDPKTLVASVHDQTYAVFASSTDVSCLAAKPGCPGPAPYAVASACVTNYDASGRANIDLRGMGFHLAGTGAEMFLQSGFTPAGAAEIDDARQVVELTGGGDCGSFGASSGLPLAQDF